MSYHTGPTVTASYFSCLPSDSSPTNSAASAVCCRRERKRAIGHCDGSVVTSCRKNNRSRSSSPWQSQSQTSCNSRSTSPNKASVETFEDDLYSGHTPRKMFRTSSRRRFANDVDEKLGADDDLDSALFVATNNCSALPSVASLLTQAARNSSPVQQALVPAAVTPLSKQLHAHACTPAPVASETEASATPPPSDDDDSPAIMTYKVAPRVASRNKSPNGAVETKQADIELPVVTLSTQTYLLMNSLPDHYMVRMHQHCRMPQSLLPAKTSSKKITLALDLDETLVHCGFNPISGADIEVPLEYGGRPYTVFGRCRPHLQQFLEEVSKRFEVVCFTASQRLYAEQIVKLIDPNGCISHCLYRDSCVVVRGNFLKDLSLLGRDLRRTVLLDNSPHAFGYQLDNGVPISSWFDNRDDTDLLTTLEWLKTLEFVDDVRPHIRNKFRLRERLGLSSPPSPESQTSQASRPRWL